MFSEALTNLVAASGTVLAGPFGPLDLPDPVDLTRYDPPETSRVYLADGSLLTRHFRENRVFYPVGDLPPLLVQAFVSAEDQGFRGHDGIDFPATLRASLDNVTNALTGSGRLFGASTISQQVVKNLLLSPDVSLDRKLREAILAVRLEDLLSKDEILEIYLNHIYFGRGVYGIGMAAASYFGKRPEELTLAEIAYLAGLPKAPNNYHPINHLDRALARRAYVLNRLAEDGVITEAEAEAAKAEPLVTVIGTETAVASMSDNYFTEEIRRQLVQRLGGDYVASEGLSIWTTLDLELQEIAERALREGLIEYDRRHGWRGPVAQIDATLIDDVGSMPELVGSESGPTGAEAVVEPPAASTDGLSLRQALMRLATGDAEAAAADPGAPGSWQEALAAIEMPPGAGDWRLAVVLATEDETARIGLGDGETGVLRLADLAWARRVSESGRLGAQPDRIDDVVSAGDVVLTGFSGALSDDGEDVYDLRQVPEVQGALVAMDQHTGRVLAIAGGFDFETGPFNRATQAFRQPGSAFKPFVYTTALELGYPPNTLLLDTPIAVSSGDDQGLWRPKNYDGDFMGAVPMRVGVERSRNLMTVRLLTEIGLEPVADMARRVGVYEDMPLYYSFALGAGETTVMDLTAAYAMIATGGRRVEPTLFDRIQDRQGQTLYRRDDSVCVGCAAAEWSGQATPPLLEPFNPQTDQVIDPVSAFQMLTMLQGVTTRGTGARLASLGLPLAGKTGTTNDTRDAWFVGFSPVLTAGVFVGFDDNRSLGNRETGASAALPIFRQFMAEAMEGRDPGLFPTPSGIQTVMIDRMTGQLVGDGGIPEYFRAGTVADPPSTGVVLTRGSDPASGVSGTQLGTGGLY